ncbi:N-acetyl-D-Glu racemase DgcA [Sphingomonas sp. VNH70]|uniref:N-acetyl-D-Glu racemase DgcA n=1 Tax=Sphingomonas silueang TaxID=3156617 RepID=UPI0032B36698
MMRRLSAAHERLPLHTPFRISRGVKTAADVVVATIAEGTRIGRGEAVPYARYGESVESVLAQIAGVAGAIDAGADRDALQDLLPPGAARNAIDCALWDLAGAPPAPAKVASAITVVLDTAQAMHAAARAHAHVPLLKVKVDATDPAAQIAAVRAAAPSPALIVDPNEGWSLDLLSHMRDVLVEQRVALIEQPLPATDDAALAGFDAGVPLCADESVHVAGDLDRVVGRYAVVNVKLDKAGGLTAALGLVAAARARGLGVMTGCMVASSLGIAPALRIAGLSDFVDLDGPLWLAQDRAGGVRDEGGWLRAPDRGFWG